MLGLRQYLGRSVSTVASVASDPMEAWIRVRERYAAYRDGYMPADLYKADDNWESELHRILGPGLDQLKAEFWVVWPQVIADLEAKGIQAGPASFKGWNDGDAAFVRAVWCLTRHLRPANVVETGVAHGVTSRVILEALEKNGNGHLWSIDRPPIEPEWQQHIGMAVDSRLKHRWTYINGSSRRHLPALLAKTGAIELFVHDSLHSELNVRFEMEQAWAVLRPGCAMVVDDIDLNRAFKGFSSSHSDHRSFVCAAEPLRPDARRFNKKGLFGINLKASQDTPLQ